MHRRILLVSAIILISISFGVTAAQGGVLTPGGGQLASLTEQTPLSIFNFSGNEGDLATVRVQGLTSGMSVSLSLLSPSQDSLGSNNDAPHAGASGSTSVSARLPRAGTYTALVGGTPGDYVISLDLFTPPAAQPLGTDAPATASLFAESPIHVYSFNANPSGALSVTLNGGEGSSDFSASFYNPDGLLTSFVTGLANACLGIPAGDGAYLLLIELEDAESTFDVSITLRNGDCGSTGTTAQPAATPELSGPPPTVCTAFAGSAANIRSGPGTQYDIIGVLNAGQSIPIVGTSGTGWYSVQSAAIPQGWIAASVITAAGPCDNLPTVGATQPQPPVATEEVEPGTPTYTYTASPTLDPAQPTYTYTATLENGFAPTYTYTPTHTPTATANTAPPDGDYNLTIPLDSTAAIAEFVSYPDGDTNDRVYWDISGMNANSALSGGRARLVLTVSCFGTGTQNIQISTQGQTYSCGQTVFDREVTYDSRTGSMVISAVSGDGVFVNWAVQGTATRIN